MFKMLSQSASRALGLLIAKSKALGGMPFEVFTKLYDFLVWRVIVYGAAIWVAHYLVLRLFRIAP